MQQFNSFKKYFQKTIIQIKNIGLNLYLVTLNDVKIVFTYNFNSQGQVLRNKLSVQLPTTSTAYGGERSQDT